MLDSYNFGIYVDSLGFGLTDCDPYLISREEMPQDANFFVNRQPEYWFVKKNLFTPPPSTGDRLTFTVKGNGTVEITKDDGTNKVLDDIDVTKKLWAFWSIFGHTTKIEIIPYANERSMIPKTTLDKILILFSNVETVLESRLAKDQHKYDQSIYKLPYLFRDYYHVLASYFLQFMIILFDDSNGNEALQLTTKDDWKYMEESGLKYYQKVILFLRIFILF